MARRGGATPKDPEQMANSTRAKAEKAKLRVVTSEAVPAPDLPEFMPDGSEWPDHTIEWWDIWADSPLCEDYRAEDWQDLIDCAVIHGRLWQGDYKAAAELRLRMARHGATREDRARLRIVFATAEQREKEARKQPAGKTPEAPDTSSRGRRGGLHGVG